MLWGRYHRPRNNGTKSMLAGMSEDIASKAIDGYGGLCLDLSQFLQVFHRVHSTGKQHLLEPRFRSQHLHCFRHAPPSEWSVVTTAKSPNAACMLERVVSGDVSLKSMLGLRYVHWKSCIPRQNLPNLYSRSSKLFSTTSRRMSTKCLVHILHKSIWICLLFDNTSFVQLS